ncbi:MAG: hypothetical protein KA052_00285 [Candidatus Pacebacteria bacterium]|nr:hypothetical protein [Candidatus Paceibacterota bacterium]
MEAQTRVCQNCNNDFIIDSDDFGFYEKVKVPPPTFCFYCRMQRRQMWKNNLSLYSRKCVLCQKSIITLYSPEGGITPYCHKCWWSDKWDPKDYGQDYDFSKPFFVQFRELLQKVPHMATVTDDGIASLNCEYTNDCWFAKNCYMTFYSWRIENIMYSEYMIYGAKDCVDCLNIFNQGSWLYECSNCDKSFRLRNSQFSVSCSESHFLYDCRNCIECFMCTGLRNKKYHFKNVEYTKEEYEKIVESYRLDTWEGVQRAQKEYDEFILLYPRRFAYIFHSLNSTGDMLTDAKNSKYCFSAEAPENCRYFDNGAKPKDSYDINTAGEMTDCYEGITIDHSHLNHFGIYSVKSQDIRYTQQCHSSKHLFGCVSLRNGNYCILNKQYTKEEYEELIPRIIAHMNEMPYVDKAGCVYKFGEFYPGEQSMYGYNESIASEEFPMTKEDILARGYNWQDKIQRTTGKETLTPDKIPQAIDEVPDTLVNEILVCESCGRNYKVIQNELIFYRKLGVPVPRRCFHCRHALRQKRRNPFRLWHRQCMCTKDNHEHADICDNQFETTYAPERPEIIYCEGCYQKEVN